MKNRIHIMPIFAAGSAALAAAACSQGERGEAARQTPNVVFILADDLGWGDLSCYGQQKFSTPNLDALARRGLKFTQCYSGTTVSAPSRSCLITGTHSGHTAVRGNRPAKSEVIPEGQYPLPAGSQTIFRDFQDAGYRTGAFGKWGLGFIGTTGDPREQGVDDFFGYNCQTLAHSYYPDHLWSNDQKVILPDNVDEVPYGEGTYSADVIHEHALEFMQSAVADGQPFFMWYPTTIPHAELIVPQDSIITRLRGQYPETPFAGVDQGMPRFRIGGYCSQEYPHATFAAMVTRLDVYVGQIVEELKRLGVYDNTIIMFASDNGPHMEGGADPDFFDSNGPWRGYKRDLYEGGIRVPMIIQWPGHIAEGGETDFVCSFWDMMPTFREIITGGRSAASPDSRAAARTSSRSSRISSGSASSGIASASTSADASGSSSRISSRSSSSRRAVISSTDVSGSDEYRSAVEPWNELDGISMLPLLLGDADAQTAHDFLYFEFAERNARASRIGPWKLINQGLNSGHDWYELYNLDDDPGETHDLLGHYCPQASAASGSLTSPSSATAQSGSVIPSGNNAAAQSGSVIPSGNNAAAQSGSVIPSGNNAAAQSSGSGAGSFAAGEIPEAYASIFADLLAIMEREHVANHIFPLFTGE